MIRAEMIARISSLELSQWMALANVQHDEHEEARDAAESGDGVVIYHGREDVDDEHGDD